MSAYRRGTVLGLTVAEIFILLAFLLLFALLLRQILEDEAKAKIYETSSSPSIWERPKEIETLAQANVELDKAEAAIKEIEEQLEDTAQELNDVADQLDESKVAQTEAERAQAEAKREQAETEQELDEAKQSLEKAEAEKEEVANEFETFKTKGENPPCWYTVVPDGNDGTREKPLYTFNVAIHENSIELARRDVPPGGAFDDSDELYSAEWDRLRIDDLPYGEPLSDSEFRNAVEPLAERANQSKVRTYPCIFWVMVWDKTPLDAKSRWKRVHDQIIEGSFGAYEARNIEWQNELTTVEHGKEKTR